MTTWKTGREILTGIMRKASLPLDLLLSDLAVRRASQNWSDAAVLPSYARLIVDEGHHLEDAAASHLGDRCDRHCDHGGQDRKVAAFRGDDRRAQQHGGRDHR